jgi:GNAT superfamily N-acetyltransferase
LAACQIEGFQIQPLGETHLREAFSCNNDIIDAFLRDRSLKDHARYKVRVRVATVGDDPSVLGFYSLALKTLAPKKNLFGIGNKFGERQIPAVYLAMIATHADYQKKGIGTDLMFDAFEKTLSIADLAGTACLTLDAVDEEKAVWYETLSFQRLGPDGLSMYIPIGTVREACEAAAMQSEGQELSPAG